MQAVALALYWNHCDYMHHRCLRSEYLCAGGGRGFYDLPRTLKERGISNISGHCAARKRSLREICSLFVVVIFVVTVAVIVAVAVVQIKAIKTRESRKRQGGGHRRHSCPRCNAFKANGGGCHRMKSGIRHEKTRSASCHRRKLS